MKSVNDEHYLNPGSGKINADRSRNVTSVQRAIKILICLSRGINNLTGIAAECDLSNATVHRLLKTLEETGAVFQDPASRRYFLGRSIIGLTANPNLTHELLILSAEKEVRLLSACTEETVSLLSISGLKLVRLFSVPSRHPLRVVDIPDEERRVGDIYTGAPAKVLLSQYPEDKFRQLLRYIKLEIAENPAINIEELMLQIKQIRKQGYAVTAGETVKGGLCISVPVRDYVMPVSLNIYGPAERIKPRTADYLEKAMESAERISTNIRNIFHHNL
ncbi:MAG: helix-turn-helix domain-containing protein [Dehalococcoidales bacterium]|jgi:DNA-binding IclR family transcriptional regulator|nr:helix-turn-helix domain-containing protein [Dehalococcoidales bacterium]